MNATPWMLVLALVICGFWMVGAHNRIVGLRSGIAEAWARVDALLGQRGATLAALTGVLWELWPNGRGTMDALSAAQGQFQAVVQAVRARPARAASVAPLLAAEGALGATLARLLNLVESDPALHTHDEVATRMLALFELGPQLIEARQRFNQAAVTYNEAIHQFPTRLLAPVFRFDVAGPF
jgi:LemA protein